MRNAILMTLIMVGTLTGRGAVLPIASLYSRGLGASYGNIAMLGTVASIFSLSSSYLWGHISDRHATRKRYMLAGLITLMIVRAITATVTDYVYLFPLGAIEAVALAAVNVTSLALMGDILERSSGRGMRMGVYRGLGSIGFGVMAFFAGGLADRLGMPSNYIGSSAIVGLAVICAMLVREEPQAPVVTTPEPGQSRPTDKAQSRPNLPLTPLLVAALVWFATYGAVYSVWANYMVEEMGYSPTVMTRLWSTASSSELVFMILAGWLSDRVGRLPMLAIGLVAWGLVFAGYVTLPMLPWIVLVQLLRGFGLSAYTATAMTYVAESRSRESRGRASGLYTSASGLGSILGTMAGGSLVHWLGFQPMIAICIALSLATAVYLGIVSMRWKKTVLQSVTS